MKRILFALIALTAMASVSAQEIQIYRNGELIQSYTNNPREHYIVKFTDVGNLDRINGHEFVVIAGLKWATMNVGATTVAGKEATSYGDFYAWGEVDTYYKSCPIDSTITNWKSNATATHIPGSKYSHNWINYSGDHNKDNKFYEWDPKPYDANYVLKADYDVARKSWGGTWRIPKQSDFIKLINACGGYNIKQLPADASTINEGGIYWVPAVTTIDGFPYEVAGFLFVEKEDPNNRVFFPAAGNIQNIWRKSATTLCTYWCSTAYNAEDKDNKTQDLSKAYCLYVSSTSGIKRNYMPARAYGLSIRPVSD